MFNKPIMATLIAGSFVAAQASATTYSESTGSMDAAGSISDRGYETQLLEPLSEDSFPSHVTVYNPDGTSYALVADADTALQPQIVVMTLESMPTNLTVFDPDGTVTSYQFTPVDVALIEPMFDGAAGAGSEGILAFAADQPLILVEVAEPMILAIADDGSLDDPILSLDAEGAPWSISAQVAAFDDALEHTG